MLNTYSCPCCGERWIDMEGGSTCWKCGNVLLRFINIWRNK
jgi:transposase